jgi:hypothetical protein
MKRISYILMLCLMITWGLYGQKGGENEARSLLMKFLQPGCDYVAMTNQLKPTTDDYKAYFDDQSWQKAMTNYNELWAQFPGFIKPKQGQSELLLWKATLEELKTGGGDARQFPGGYQQATKHIRPGITIYRFKFVKPGSTLGMAFDGLVFINGHWVIFPKPWRVLK